MTIVNEDGTDNAVVGDSFYAYWAFTPRWDDPVCLDVDNLPPQCVCTDTVKAPAPNCGLRRVVRQKVALVAP